MQKIDRIDAGKPFDFGRTSGVYGRYRDIYPASLYRKLRTFGVVTPGSSVLDVGTGTGVLPRHLADSGANLTGTDISPEQIKEARRLSEGLPIRYEVATAENVPFPDRSFDAVTACQCFHYFDPERFAAELKRVLKPGGLFCRIDMEWLPFEDEIARLTEEVVLRYNPAWNGKEFRPEPPAVPEWACHGFELETWHACREELPFTIDSWSGRIRTCRGVGASLEPPEIAAFEAELRRRLAEVSDGAFTIRHWLRLEIYRLQ